VVVLGVNPGEKRISLGLKQALGDPWEEAERKYAVGSVIEAPRDKHDELRRVRRFRRWCRGHDSCRRRYSREAARAPKEFLQNGQVVKAQVLEFDRGKRRIRLGMKQLEPTSTDHYIAEHTVGETVTGRVVEVKGERVKVELGDGVFGHCKLPASEAPEQKGGGGSRNAERADVMSAAAMLAAKFKSGGLPLCQRAHAGEGHDSLGPDTHVQGC
jgi:small subunit ribosomal protein S1